MKIEKMFAVSILFYPLYPFLWESFSSNENFPGPMNKRLKNKIPASRAWEYFTNESPFFKCSIVATIIVFNKKKHAGRVNNPNINNMPPPNSEIAAIKPIDMGAKLMPTADNAPPSFTHASGPALSFGKPWQINIIPIPSRKIKKPSLRYRSSLWKIMLTLFILVLR